MLPCIGAGHIRILSTGVADVTSNGASSPVEIQRAIDVVGTNDPPDNRNLNPGLHGQKHIASLEVPAAAPLVRVLKSPPVQTAFADYQRNDNEAVQAQNSYKRSRLVILVPLVVALAVGLFGFVTTSITIEQWLKKTGIDDNTARIAAHLGPLWIVTAMLFITPILSLIFRPNQLYELWMTRRGVAEAIRRELFERVLAAPAEQRTAEEISPLLLKLEYFRRYQMELQTAYHRTRGREHEHAAKMARRLIIVANALLLCWVVLSVSACMAGRTEQGGLSGPELVMNTLLRMAAPLQQIEILDIDFQILAATVLLAAAYAVVWLYVLLSGSVRNAARYATMRTNFEELNAEIGAVRAKALANDEAAVKAFVERVHSIMSLELADWVRLAALDHGRDGVAQEATT
jgi:hypothetical protein